MPRITYKGKLPSPEQFQKDLRTAQAKSNPIDDLLDLWTELQQFEQKYNLPSEDFYRQYQAGQQSDEEYCLEWAAVYEIFHGAKEKITFGMPTVTLCVTQWVKPT